MAIEFNCPYCTAKIRVPDPYAGKQGRCPKCDTRLLIPNVPLPNAPAPTEPLPLVAVENLPVVVDPNPGGSAGPITGTEEPFAVRPVVKPVIKSRRRQARRRPSRALVIGLPVICFLILFGIIAVTLTSSLPKLQGELTGRPLEATTLSRSTIFWGDLSLNEDDRMKLQDALSVHPESLTSRALICRLSSDDDGIVVTLSAQSESQWIAVDVSAEKPLAIWKRKEGPPLNRHRLDELRASAASYVGDKLRKIDGEQIAIDAVAVRDKVAMNAGGGALSYAIQAIADSTIFPCAAEDAQGHLYFCLPKTVRSFVIQGRTFTDGRSAFTGEYTVTISNEKMTTETIPDPVDGTSTAEDSDKSEMTNEMPDASKPISDNEDSESMEKISPE